MYVLMMKWRLKRKAVDSDKSSSEICGVVLRLLLLTPESLVVIYLMGTDMLKNTGNLALLNRKIFTLVKYWFPLSSRNNTKTRSWGGNVGGVHVLCCSQTASGGEFQVWGFFLFPPPFSASITCSDLFSVFHCRKSWNNFSTYCQFK